MEWAQADVRERMFRRRSTGSGTRGRLAAGLWRCDLRTRPLRGRATKAAPCQRGMKPQPTQKLRSNLIACSTAQRQARLFPHRNDRISPLRNYEECSIRPHRQSCNWWLKPPQRIGDSPDRGEGRLLAVCRTCASTWEGGRTRSRLVIDSDAGLRLHRCDGHSAHCISPHVGSTYARRWSSSARSSASQAAETSAGLTTSIVRPE